MKVECTYGKLFGTVNYRYMCEITGCSRKCYSCIKHSVVDYILWIILNSENVVLFQGFKITDLHFPLTYLHFFQYSHAILKAVSFNQHTQRSCASPITDLYSSLFPLSPCPSRPIETLKQKECHGKMESNPYSVPEIRSVIVVPYQQHTLFHFINLQIEIRDVTQACNLCCRDLL